MTKKDYAALLGWFNARPAAKRALRAVSKGSVAVVYLTYVGTAGVLALRRDPRLLATLAVPAAVFVLGTALRRAINRPRPYETLGFAPLFPKNTRGQSMPSRHCFSAAAIAVAVGRLCPPLGWGLWAAAACIALTRVLTGVHYPGDVLAGLAFGGIAAAVGLAVW